MPNLDYQGYTNTGATPSPDINGGGGMMMPGLPPEMEEEETVGKRKQKLIKAVETVNLAEDLDKEELDKIGDDVYNGYRRDLESKEGWDTQVDCWVKLAAQIREERSYPWPKASNIKYPLLAIAAMQFAARAYPSLVPPDGKIVQFRTVGIDIQGMKAAKADKLAKHMNYQLLEDMEDWEEEMDRLLIQLPVVGCLFKKTYFDGLKKKNVSRLVGPKDLVVNYWTTSLQSSHRVTEIIPMTKNMVKSHVNAGEYLDVELDEPTIDPELPQKTNVHGNQPPSQADDSTPYVILEQHTYWDLDDDGYQEPYIITIEAKSRKVLRIVARFDSDGIYTNDQDEVVCIDPVQYYTKYGFIPNPDGSFYDIGFGHLLGPLNESTNTIINQLTDAGTLQNLQAGFIGKGLRIKLGETKFQPGEWKQVNAVGDDLKKQIFPLPVNPPSDVLFQLLGMLIESGKQLASVAEIFTGKMPGQNTPATTTQTAVEQGMKVFTAIYKRTWRSLTKEFKKVFRLNSIYEENFAKARLILDEPITPEDYDIKLYDVCPTADPSAVSTTQKLQKAAMLMELLPLGTINPIEVTKRILEAQEQPNIEALMQGAPGPQPDPKVAQVQAKMEMEKEKHQMDMVAKKMELQFKQIEAMMDQKFMQMEKMLEFRLKEMEFGQKAQHQVKQAQLDQMTGAMDMNLQQRQGSQKMQQSEQQHNQKMKQLKESANVQSKQRGVSSVAKSSSNNRNDGGSKT